MSEVKNEHYGKVVERMSAGKDSIFEIGEVTKFDSKTLTASILGLRTKEVKEDVIVAFPNLFMNSGQIIFPLNKTRGLLYVGPDNQNFFLPAQFHLPFMDSDKISGKASLDASPEKIDPNINFSDFEQGEFLYRHISGSQIVFRNTGAIEIMTNKLHGFSLDSETGEVRTTAEQKTTRVGYSEFFNGVIQPRNSKEKSKHVFKMSLSDSGPEWKSLVPIPLGEALENLKNEVPIKEIDCKKVFTLELVNILDENGDEVLMESTGKPLMKYLNIDYDKYEYVEQVDKEGKTEIVTKEKEGKRKKKVIKTIDGDSIEIFDASGNNLTVNVSANKINLTMRGGVHNKKVEIGNDGITFSNGGANFTIKNNDIEFKTSNGSTSINAIIDWMRG